ncbi:helix-turn-helix domain-containing protein [Mesorhizobium koreense]|jgi:chromosomal replication initiation ATPase DnaA|uniref:helix-turn-helix domain-containing protein n=1 Tax=Mesorhizobium koreense TaxID=3074855 RepID=UPI00287B9740|nr:helix-turn-helix domain-containing protein [Mesorhizobium sp. WR6]
MKYDRAVEWCDCLIDIASALFNVSGKELRRPGRSTLDITRVRQIAMYVGHVVLRLTMADVGRGFGRDRTTVLYACHLVEDMRDDADFDRIVATMERVAGAAFRERGTI